MQKSKEHIHQCFLHFYKLGNNEKSETKRKIYQAIDKDAVSTKTACRFCNEDFLFEDQGAQPKSI